MSKRLDQEREKRLQPKRIQVATNEVEKLGYYVIYNEFNKAIYFLFNGNTITYYPYSGWATGKGINDGRGLKKLLKQIKNG